MEIKLTTYKGNSVYSIYIIDKWDRERHIGYVNASEINNLSLNNSTILAEAEQIYESIKPPCPEQERMASAIKSMIDLDIKRGVEPNLD